MPREKQVRVWWLSWIQELVSTCGMWYNPRDIHLGHYRYTLSTWHSVPLPGWVWVSTETHASPSCPLLCFLMTSLLRTHKERDQYGLHSIQVGLSSEGWVGFWFWKVSHEKWEETALSQRHKSFFCVFLKLTEQTMQSLVQKIRENTGMRLCGMGWKWKVKF